MKYLVYISFMLLISWNGDIVVQGIVNNQKTYEPLICNLYIQNLDSGEEVAILQTSENGTFTVSLPPGQYSFNCLAEGFRSNYRMVAIDSQQIASSTYTLDIFMVPIEVSAQISINNLYFEEDSSRLQSEGLLELNKIAELLKKNPEIQLAIEGHASANEGTDEEKIKLSEQRAKSAFDFLVDQGINPERISIKGYGDRIPATGIPEDILNRRVDFNIIN